MNSSSLQAFGRTLPQLQEMVELGGMKIKKIHATRFDKILSIPEKLFLILSCLQGMDLNH